MNITTTGATGKNWIEGEDYQYDGSTHTLRLLGGEYGCSETIIKVVGVQLNLVIVGDFSVTVADKASITLIDSDNSITITGNGTLETKCQNDKQQYTAIKSKGLTIGDSAGNSIPSLLLGGEIAGAVTVNNGSLCIKIPTGFGSDLTVNGGSVAIDASSHNDGKFTVTSGSQKPYLYTNQGCNSLTKADDLKLFVKNADGEWDIKEGQYGGETDFIVGETASAGLSVSSNDESLGTVESERYGDYKVGGESKYLINEPVKLTSSPAAGLFKNWTDGSGKVISESESTMVIIHDTAEQNTYVGNFETAYTVTFHYVDEKGGQGTHQIKVASGHCVRPIDYPGAPGKGLEFVCWSTANPGTIVTQYDFCKHVTGNLDLYPCIETENTYCKVIFYVDGSAYDLKATANGGTISKPTSDPTKEGYTFDGWYDGENKFDFSTPIAHNLELHAHFTKSTDHTVTFYVDGQQYDQQTVHDGELASEPAAPTKEGYTFDGWYDGENKFDFSTPITADLRLDAKFTKVSTDCTVQFKDADGKTVATSVVVTSGSKITEPSVKPTGKVITGWYCNNVLWNFENDKVTGNMTLVMRVATVEDKSIIVDASDCGGKVDIELNTGVKEVHVIFSDSAVTIKDLASDKDLSIAVNKLQSGEKYDISVKLGGVEYKDKEMSIMLQYDVTGGNPTLYYYPTTGEKQKMDATFDETTGLVVFTTTHNSVYGIEYSSEPVSPTSSDNGYIPLFIVVVLVILAIAAIGVKRD